MFVWEESEHLKVAPTREPVISIRVPLRRFHSDFLTSHSSVLTGWAGPPSGWWVAPTARVPASHREIESPASIFWLGGESLTLRPCPADAALPCVCLLFDFLRVDRHWWKARLLFLMLLSAWRSLESVFENSRFFSSQESRVFRTSGTNWNQSYYRTFEWMNECIISNRVWCNHPLSS